MSHHNTISIWKPLLEAGLVQDPPPQSRELESPWFVKILLALSGWLAALCLFAFIGMVLKSHLFESSIAFIAGSLLMGAAIGVLRLPKKEFYEHLAIATSLTGQALVVFAAHNYIKEINETLWLFVALLQVFLIFVIPNFIHRVFSTYFAVVALSILMMSSGGSFIFSIILVFATCWLWLNEFRNPKYMKMTQAIAYGLILSMNQLSVIVITTFSNFNTAPIQPNLESWVQPWMSEIPIGLPMLYVAWQLLKRQGRVITDLFSIMILLGVVIVNIISMEVPGLNAGLLVMVLGYSGSNRVILGLGIIILLHNLSSYYYFLDTTLLVKSQMLFLTGILSLTARWLMLRYIPKSEGADHV